jgi:GNAT superfamily N-acetyltransferase
VNIRRPRTRDDQVNYLKHSTATSPTAVWTCSWRQGDRQSIFNLLSFLPDYYPGGWQWLDRRLDDVERGRAACTIGGIGKAVSGILIETPKGRRSTKISTLYVRPIFAGFGLGAKLFDRHEVEWSTKGIDRVHITVASERLEAIANFLLARGFTATAQIENRYRHDRAETVFALDIH